MPFSLQSPKKRKFLPQNLQMSDYFCTFARKRANKTKNERLSTDIRRAVCLSLATGERDGGCCERIENKKVKHKKATILCKAILRTTTPPSFILVKNP